MHHNGKIYNSKNIQQLLDKRYMNAQIRKQGGRHKGPHLLQSKIKKCLNNHY